MLHLLRETLRLSTLNPILVNWSYVMIQKPSVIQTRNTASDVWRVKYYRCINNNNNYNSTIGGIKSCKVSPIEVWLSALVKDPNLASSVEEMATFSK